MAQPMEIVHHRAVTSEWLTRALASRGVDATVAGFDVEQVGTGQLGETRRFFLRYAGSPARKAPATVVGKFPSDTENARESGRGMGFYRSELMFYRELAHRAQIKTPFVYVAEIDDLGDFALLFEDMAPSRAGNHMRGMTQDEVGRALDEAALLHATFWNDTELMNADWCYVPEGAQGFYTTTQLEQSWDYFKKTYPGRLAPEVVEVCERFVACHGQWNAPRGFPKTFSHNDFRADNMLFPPDGGRITTVDWQTSAFLGSGMDVAYLLGGALDRETLRANERSLLRRYYDRLVGLGVGDYDFEDLLAHYRHYTFAVLVVAIVATVIVKRTERGDDLFMRMVTDGAYQALDSGAVDELP